MSETVESIAARYGAVVKPGLEVKKIPRGTSSAPKLIWDDKRGLVYEVKPDLQRLTFGGKPPTAISVDGRTWRSMGDLARHLGVSLASVSKAFKKGRVRELIARHERKAA